MRKNVFAAALILALGVGSFAACSSDDVVTPQHGTETLGGTTFMAVKFAIPQGSSQRSATDYNPVGPWSGRDDVQGYKAYIFDATANTLEAVQVLTSADFTQAAVGNDYVITPNKAIRVKPGNKIVYVVVNPNATTDALLPATLATTTLAQFKAAYESKNLATAGAGVFTSYSAGTFATSTKNVAKTTGSGPATKDVIVMTGKPAGVGTAFTVIDGVSESDAATGVNNQASVEVKRTVARVVVTSTANSYTLEGDNPYTTGTVETNYQIGEVKNLHFVTAQSERYLYFQQGEEASDNTSTTAKWNSPAIAQTATNDYGDPSKPQPADILKAYDYTNLWKNRVNANVLGGNEVHHATPGAGNWTADEIGKMADDCDFILPTTHKYVPIAPGAAYEYRKGNTAYVLIRAAFVPKKIQVGEDYMASTPAIAAAMTAGNLTAYITALQGAVTPLGATIDPTTGAVTTAVAEKDFATEYAAGNEPNELVYGVGTRKFYSSEFASQDPVFQGVNGQPIQKFKKVVDAGGTFLGYKMLYFAWVNPDNITTGWYNSPVYRNNIYHVEIDGIGGLGENWNPLVPATPNPGGVPSNDPNHPNNPDPFVPNGSVTLPKPPTTGSVPPTPITPPVTPVVPIKPEDPLTQKKTHMSVKVTVLPWQVHSYKFKLQN